MTREKDIKEEIRDLMIEINGLKLDRNVYVMMVIIGMILNFFVVSANGYQMPAFCDDTKYNCHFESSAGKSILGETDVQFIYTDKATVKFWWLSDIIRIDIKNQSMIFSPGDIIMLVSIIILFLCAIKEIRKIFKVRKLQKEWNKLNHLK